MKARRHRADHRHRPDCGRTTTASGRSTRHTSGTGRRAGGPPRLRLPERAPRSPARASCSFELISGAELGVALFDEGLAQLVGVTEELELIREPLLEAVGAFYVDRLDDVERLLGATNDERTLLGDHLRDLTRRVHELIARHHALDGAVRQKLLRGDHLPR